jgi:hypothetical protein
MPDKPTQPPSKYDVVKIPGTLRLASIDHIDTNLMIAYVKLTQNSLGSPNVCPAQLPMAYLSSGGGFIGGYPGAGTPVLVAQADGASSYFIVAFLARDPAAQNPNTTGATQIQIPDLVEGQITIQANSDSSITLNDDGISIGAPTNLVAFDTNREIFLNSFDSAYTLTQATREIAGVVKRDVKPSKNFATYLRYDDISYDDTLKTIGMDPVAASRNFTAGNYTRNPARNEKREVVFEYEYISNVKSNDKELANYNVNGTTPTQANFSSINRREGRDDVLSLSLISPNFLMEEIKGTVIDIFRNIIPIGSQEDNLSVLQVINTMSNTDPFQNVYEQIKREERKSLAYHFEINARKEQGILTPPNINDQTDYARARSRFFFDIDKEGQFKLNVPASSESGNIPLLTRYENYSTVNPNPQTNNPNDMVFNENGIDILIEPFLNNQVITLQDALNISAAPINRFSPQGSPMYIGHGSVYHNISQTCSTLNANSFYTAFEYVQTTNMSYGPRAATAGTTVPGIVPITNIVSPTIIVSGPNANAGGRSGSMNFDGSVEINIGANTVDKQSLWLDTEGGMLWNVGRDIHNAISLAANFDGYVMFQIGGPTVPAETSRFIGENTGIIAGVLDIRVYSGTTDSNNQPELTIFRMDANGISITTPNRLNLYCNGDMMLRNEGTMTLDSANLILQGRKVIRGGLPI